MRYIIGLLITVGLIVLIIVLLLSGPSTPAKPPLDLGSYANTGAVAELIIDGPITAEQTHDEAKIDISQGTAAFTLYQGYQQTVLKTQSYPNNESAYAVFLHALQHLNFTKGNNDPALHDERGYCPAGTRYIFSFIGDNGQDLERYWSTTCGGTHTYEGNTAGTVDLFQKQIPGYNTLVQNAILD